MFPIRFITKKLQVSTFHLSALCSLLFLDWELILSNEIDNLCEFLWVRIKMSLGLESPLALEQAEKNASGLLLLDLAEEKDKESPLLLLELILEKAPLLLGDTLDLDLEVTNSLFSL